MNNQKFNVYMSGGGLKGAYQYGFFKKLYKIWPNIQIEKIYAVSVGALNAGPIAVKKMDKLKYYWENNKNPAEQIIENWYNITEYAGTKAICNIYNNGAVYQGIKEDNLVEFWNNLNQQEKITINKKLVIVAFDTINKKPAFLKTTNATNFKNNIKASINIPYLFKNIENKHIIDGCVVPFDVVKKQETNNEWIVLDLAKYKNNIFNYAEPLTLEYNNVQKLIKKGEKDAELFKEKKYR